MASQCEHGRGKGPWNQPHDQPLPFRCLCSCWYMLPACHTSSSHLTSHALNSNIQTSPPTTPIDPPLPPYVIAALRLAPPSSIDRPALQCKCQDTLALATLRSKQETQIPQSVGVWICCVARKFQGPAVVVVLYAKDRRCEIRNTPEPGK
jgi:hypothetical protein